MPAIELAAREPVEQRRDAIAGTKSFKSPLRTSTDALGPRSGFALRLAEGGYLENHKTDKALGLEVFLGLWRKGIQYIPAVVKGNTPLHFRQSSLPSNDPDQTSSNSITVVSLIDICNSMLRALKGGAFVGS